MLCLSHYCRNLTIVQTLLASFVHSRFIMARSLRRQGFFSFPLSSSEAQDAHSLILNVVRRPARRDGSPTGTQYTRTGHHLSSLQTLVHCGSAFTSSQTGFPHTILVAERCLVLKSGLFLLVSLPQHDPKGMQKQFLAITSVPHHDRGCSDRHCPIVISNHRCMHGVCDVCPFGLTCW